SRVSRWSSGNLLQILRFRPRVEEPIFLLTRVTRILQKIVFTETTRDARAGCRAGLFVARTRVRPAGHVSRVCKKTGKYRRSHSFREAKAAIRPPARAGRATVWAARARPPPGGRRLAVVCVRYSAIVFTTLEVGRVSPTAPPAALTALSTCSS